MLSILVPVYNFDARNLLQTLHEQGLASGQAFEIIVLDDASDAKFVSLHQELNHLEHFYYEPLEQNVGRSRIRNLLCQRAKFPYLLYLDCDAKVPDTHFLSRYFQHLKTNTILCGGRTYQNQPPDNSAFFLHWLVGKAREEQSAKTRTKQGFQAFMSNNYVVPKAVQEAIPFEEAIQEYGHEDTLFGQELEAAGLNILHLDNPLEHIGLETATVFLQKSKKAIHNLVYLHQHYPDFQTKLLDTAFRMRRLGVSRRSVQLFEKQRDRLERNLLGRRPDLTLFDIWKLGFLLSCLQERGLKPQKRD